MQRNDISRPRVPRQVITGGAVAAIAFGSLLSGAGSSSASVPGHEVITAQGGLPVVTTSQFSTPATCTGGKKLVGMGWDVGNSAEVLPAEADVTDHSVSVQGHTDANGFNAAWNSKAYATCINTPFGYAFEDNSLTDATGLKSVTATCPGGTVALGAGYSIETAAGLVTLNRMAIDSGHTSVTTTARAGVVPPAGNWTLRAYAFCAVAPPGYQVVESSNQTTYPDTTEVSVCPAGTVALGTGFRFQRSDGEVVPFKQAPLEYPAGSWNGISSVKEVPTGTPNDWDLVNQVTCATA